MAPVPRACPANALTPAAGLVAGTGLWLSGLPMLRDHLGVGCPANPLALLIEILRSLWQGDIGGCGCANRSQRRSLRESTPAAPSLRVSLKGAPAAR